MSSTSHPLVVIVGPTGSGKSSLALEAAKRFNGEIICADSRTVYKGMDIGTAKPSRDERDTVQHYGLDLIEPGQVFSAAEFQRLALNTIDGIARRRKLSILVGGTGLYIDSVLYDYRFRLPNSDYRYNLEQLTVDQLIDYCKENNVELPENSQNKRYVIRAIEQGGVNRQRSKHLRPKTIVVGISADKEVLEQRIRQRAAKMFAAGVVEEARQLGTTYGWGASGLDGNIYPILRRLIDGEVSTQEAIQLSVRSDLQLAKRQMTWFKRSPDIIWSSNSDELLSTIEHFLTTLLVKTWGE